ncbi:MAG TPA: DEAD/DEAH box helicase [Bacillota bacterium]|nr:DEAD/DEAH box helicase [Bacillota bacterium]
MTKHSFLAFNFKQIINQVIEQLYFKQPTNIQHEVIPLVIQGKSVIGQAATGTGKTHAYLLPLLNELDPLKQSVQYVITSPTRELATQIYQDIQTMIKLANKETKWTARLLVGGTDRKQMQQRLTTPPHIIVGTPGRILDLILSGHLSIYSAKSFVIDEADLMAELGLLESIDQLLVRAQRDIQILAFSATISKSLEHFFKKYMDHPVNINLNDELTPQNLEHHLIPLRHRERADVIIELSKVFQPYLAIIFTNGQTDAIQLAKQLNERNLKVGLLHGGMSQRERRRTLKQIEQLHFQYIVATDLVSRGIDIPGVSHVINAQLPKEVNFYVHRVGRTARAGLEGVALSLYTEDDSALIHQLEANNISFVFSDVQQGELIQTRRRNIRPKNVATRSKRKRGQAKKTKHQRSSKRKRR